MVFLGNRVIQALQLKISNFIWKEENRSRLKNKTSIGMLLQIAEIAIT